jgi:bacterioferritin
MGQKGIEIVKMDVNELINLLNKALSDEWLAYYQYWLGAKVAKGPMKDAVVAELTQHADEELDHANRLAERIIQLRGTPVLSPDDWSRLANCAYERPDDEYVEEILNQNIRGEQCAIKHYNALLEITRNADPVTYNLVVDILSDEVEHEEDLQALKEDLILMVQRGVVQHQEIHG